MVLPPYARCGIREQDVRLSLVYGATVFHEVIHTAESAATLHLIVSMDVRMPHVDRRVALNMQIYDSVGRGGFPKPA
jgi:hypothetical protein